MLNLDQIKSQLPESAKDIKLNIATVFTDQETDLTMHQLGGITLAVVYAIKNTQLIKSILSAVSYLTQTEIEAAKSAATIMAMNNIYYRFVHLVNDKSFASLPARLRMNVIANPGIDKIDFELSCLGVSAVNGCGMCIESHTQHLIKLGVSKLAIQSSIRIAAVLNAIAVALETASY